MTYNKQTWVDGDKTRPLSAARLAHMETQYDAAMADVAAAVGDPESPIGAELSATIGAVVGPLVPPLVADAIAEDDTVALAAAAAAVTAVGEVGDVLYFRQDGARNYLGNSDFAIAPSAENAHVEGNWYNVSGVRSWEEVADGPHGPQHVIRQLSASGFTTQRITADAATLAGRTVRILVTARGLENVGVTFCMLRILVSNQSGTIADILPPEQVGVAWETLPIDVPIPAGSTFVSISLGVRGGAGNGTAHGEYARVALSLAGADITETIATKVVEELDQRDVLTGPTADARYPLIGQQTAPVLSDWLEFSKGGTVGTSGAIPVALRYDDWQDQILSLSLVDEMRNRGLFGSIVLCSQLGSNPWNQTITYEDLRTWNQDYGMEVWSHGTNHQTPLPDGYDGFYREIVTSKQQIEAEGIRVMGFAQPGVSAPGYGPELDQGDWSTLPGRLLTATYPLVETDMTRAYRHLPSNLRYGLGHFTISDGATYDASVNVLQTAINLGVGVEFMIHAGNLGQGSNMTVNQLLDFFDLLEAKVNAGEIVIVQPSTLPFCDPHSDYRMNLLGNGDFTKPVSATGTGGGTWVNVTTTRSIEDVADGVDGPAKVLRVTSSGLASQSISQYAYRGLSGQTVIFEGWARGVGGPSDARVLTDALEGAGTWTKNTVKTVGTTWELVRFVFTPPPVVQSGLLVALGRASGATVEWEDVSLTVA